MSHVLEERELTVIFGVYFQFHTSKEKGFSSFCISEIEIGYHFWKHTDWVAIHVPTATTT